MILTNQIQRTPRMYPSFPDHVYSPSTERTLQVSFKRARDIVQCPDLSAAASQLARADRAVWEKAYRCHQGMGMKRVWGKLESAGGGGADLVIATPFGVGVYRVLDWSGECDTRPGRDWVRVMADGTRGTRKNQLREIDEFAQGLRGELEAAGGIDPAKNLAVASYVIFASSRAIPSFTADPRIVVGPEKWIPLVTGNGLSDELASPASAWSATSAASAVYEMGSGLLKRAVNRVVVGNDPQHDQQPAVLPNLDDIAERWTRMQVVFDKLAQYDSLIMRSGPGILVFGKLERFEDPAPADPTQSRAPAVGGGSRSLERICNRQTVRHIVFEHAHDGILQIPLAFATGVAGWAPITRVRAANPVSILPNAKSNRPAPPPAPLASVDINIETKLIFRPFGSEQVIVAEVNDLESLDMCLMLRKVMMDEMGSAPKSEGSGEIVDYVGQMVGNAVMQAFISRIKPF